VNRVHLVILLTLPYVSPLLLKSYVYCFFVSLKVLPLFALKNHLLNYLVRRYPVRTDNVLTQVIAVHFSIKAMTKVLRNPEIYAGSPTRRVFALD
jgi:hypothetical protein